MRVLIACIYMEFALDTLAQRALVLDHAKNGVFERLSRLLDHEVLVQDLFLATRMFGVVPVDFLISFSSGNLDFFSINDNNMVPAVLMRRKIGFMLARKARGNLRCETAQDLARSVGEKPVVFNVFFFLDKRFHS